MSGEANEERKVAALEAGDGDVGEMLDAIARRGARADTEPTGFPSLDSAIGGGLRRGDLAVLGGEVGSGKSALALAVALRAAEGGARAVFLSGEMSAERTLERSLAIEGRIRVDDLRRDTLDAPSRAQLAAAAVRLRRSAPLISPLPPDGVQRLEKILASGERPTLLIVDPLQALTTRQPLEEEVAATVRALKSIALRHDVAVLATSHLHALPRDRADRRPQLSDFGALGAIAQHADVVLGLFREEMHDASQGIEGATELLVLKNRDGARGYVDLYFYKQWMRFEDVVDPER